MKRYDAKNIRNIALIGHSRTGKTSLLEAALYVTGALARKGRIEDGNTVGDYEPDEVQRQMSLSAALAPVELDGLKINLIDTPGYFDFSGEVRAALHVVEGAVVVVCAASGVEVGSELTWAMASERGLPRILFVNRMDRENADFDRVIQAAEDRFAAPIIPVALPIGAGEGFTGFIDLIGMKAWERRRERLEASEIPPEWRDRADAHRERLVEAVAATDDELTIKYLDDQPLTEEEIWAGLAAGVKSGRIVPAAAGSALSDIGVKWLLKLCGRLMPAPSETVASDGEGAAPSTGTPAGPLSALVFKTVTDPYVGKISLFRVYSGGLLPERIVSNARTGDERIGSLFTLRGKEQLKVNDVPCGDIGAVAKLHGTITSDTLCDRGHAAALEPIHFPEPTLTMAVIPQEKGDEEKVGTGLTRLCEEDPTLRFEKDPESSQFLLSGTGEMQLEVVCAKLARKFGVHVQLTPPKIPYRETVRKTVQAEYRHKKQSGGRGQYGHVFLEIAPLEPGGGFEFVDKIFGGAVPKQYIPAVEKGVRESMAEGVLAGYPVVDVRVTLYDGSYHSVDSSELAFKLAASMAFKQGFMQAQPVLLEPIMSLVVVVPEAYMGDVMADLNKKRGRIIGMERRGPLQVISAQAPQGELAAYAIDLRSLTQGRGSFTAQLDHYEEAPPHVTEAVVGAAKASVG